MTGHGPVLAVALALVAAVAVAVLIMARGSGPSHGWSEPQPIPGAGQGVARVDVDEAGRVVAAWAEERRGRWSLRVAERGADGRWAPAETVVADKAWTIRPQAVRRTGAGDLLVVFSYTSRSRSLALAAARPRGGDWQAPQALTPVRYGLAEGEVAADDRGAVTAVWGTFFRAGLTATSRAPAGAWCGGTTRADGRLVAGPFLQWNVCRCGAAQVFLAGVAATPHGAAATGRRRTGRARIALISEHGGVRRCPSLCTRPGRARPAHDLRPLPRDDGGGRSPEAGVVGRARRLPFHSAVTRASPPRQRIRGLTRFTGRTAEARLGQPCVASAWRPGAAPILIR